MRNRTVTCNCTLKSETAAQKKGKQGTVLVPQDLDIRPGLEPRVSPLDTLAILTDFLGIWRFQLSALSFPRTENKATGYSSYQHLRSPACGHSSCQHKFPQQLDNLAICTRLSSRVARNLITKTFQHPYKSSQATGHA